jgi:myosin heavy subunit
MTSLRHLHEAALTKNLEDRSSPQNQRPYTFMSNVLIALNPLKYLEGPDKSIFIDQSLDRCPPHPFYVAEVNRSKRILSVIKSTDLIVCRVHIGNFVLFVL